MPRPIWKGGISVGLVNVPVSLYAASEASEEIGFRQLHRKDLAPIQYRRVCSAEGAEVPWGEIVKGYEYDKGQFVLITDEDLAKARVEATQAIDVRDFVPADAIPWSVGDINAVLGRARRTCRSHLVPPSPRGWSP